MQTQEWLDVHLRELCEAVKKTNMSMWDADERGRLYCLATTIYCAMRTLDIKARDTKNCPRCGAPLLAQLYLSRDERNVALIFMCACGYGRIETGEADLENA